MENDRLEETAKPEQPAENKPVYTPRPWWQVVGAWVLLVVFIALMVAGYVRFFGGMG